MMRVPMIFTALLCLCISCSRDLPRTPAEAFSMTASAANAKDDAKLYHLLSKQSRDMLTRSAGLADRMSSVQKASLAQKEALPDGKLNARTVLRSWLQRDADTDPVLSSFKRTVLMIDEKKRCCKGKARQRHRTSVCKRGFVLEIHALTERR